MSRGRTALVLVVLLASATACGARLSDEQIRSVTQGVPGGGAATSESGESTGTGSEVGTASDTGTAATGGGTAGGGGTASGGGGGATTGARSASTPAGGGDNGGATDVGVTATELKLGTVATLTGPVPGLFQGAVVGAQAWAAYQNSQGGLFGRQIRIVVGDDKLSDDENRAQIIKLTPQVFGFLGSFSTSDRAGVDEMKKSGVPDVGYSLSDARKTLPTNFSPQPLPPGWRLGTLNYFKTTYGDEVIKKVGALVVNVDSPQQIWKGEKAAMQSVGYEIVYERSFQATETDFTADVVQMRQRDVKMFVMVADAGSMASVAKAFQQQNYKPELANYGANAYDPSFITKAGPAAEGAVIDQQLSLYAGEDAGKVPEVALMNQWVQKVKPGFKPDIYTAFSWASGRLFAQAHTANGAKLTRTGLIEQLKKIDDFDANGLLAPAGPASRRPPTCFVIVEVKGGKFVRKSPDSGYRCGDGGYFRL